MPFKNRNPIKQMFFTFPHSTVDKCTFRDILLGYTPEYYKVCEEKHKDGTPHLHAIVKWKNKFSQSHIVKEMQKHFPNDWKRIKVEPLRSIKHAQLYTSKEDTSPLESEPFRETRDPNKNWREKFARELGYASVGELIEQEEERRKKQKTFLKKIMNKINDFVNYEIPQMDYFTKKAFSKLCEEKRISKDDITLLSKRFEINYD